VDAELISAPQLPRTVVRGYDFERVVSLVNPRMLYNKHLGLKEPVEQLWRKKDGKAEKLRAQVEEALNAAGGAAGLDCVYSFFSAEPDGDGIKVCEVGASRGAAERFAFPRQSAGEKLCLADFVAPPSGEKRDSVALFVCTCGARILKQASESREKGDFVKSHLLNVVAMCLAEALAEAVHADIRRQWGLADRGAGSPEELLLQRYRGKRFGFGYAACPDLENQAPLFRLLRPEEIGVTLTESFMMFPECSVSALVFHSEKARYFELV